MVVYERWCVRSVFRGSIRSISMSLEAYRQLTEQQGAFGRERGVGGDLGIEEGEGVKNERKGE